MAGGQINGVSGVAAATALTPGAGALEEIAYTAGVPRNNNPNDPETYTGILVPTALQMASDSLRYWTSITALYDLNHTGTATLPICLFHVKSIKEHITNDVSEKRVILYEQRDKPKVENSLEVRPSVMQAMIDNIVNKPKTYDAEIIVPYQLFSRFFKEGINTATTMLGEAGGLIDNKVKDIWNGIFSSVFSAIDILGKVLGVADKAENIIKNTTKNITFDGSEYINKNSLEAMAQSNHILCLKMWTGYDYKFVVIKDLMLDKQAVEDDVYRGTMQLQEAPVLTVTEPQNYTGISGGSMSRIGSLRYEASKALSDILFVK